MADNFLPLEVTEIFGCARVTRIYGETCYSTVFIGKACILVEWHCREVEQPSASVIVSPNILQRLSFDHFPLIYFSHWPVWKSHFPLHISVIDKKKKGKLVPDAQDA